MQVLHDDTAAGKGVALTAEFGCEGGRALMASQVERSTWGLHAGG